MPLPPAAPTSTPRRQVVEETAAPARTQPAGSFRGLTEDPRYQSLPWEKKKVALDRFTSRNPNPLAPALTELQRLKHFSEDGTPASRKFHTSIYSARRDWLKRVAEGREASGREADFNYDRALRSAQEEYERDVDTRQRHLGMAQRYMEITDRRKSTFANEAAYAFETANPFDDQGRLDTERDNDLRERKNLLEQFGQEGFDSESFKVLLNDARLATGLDGAPAAVDSQGAVVVNDNLVVTDIEAVRKGIAALDAPEMEKDRQLATLEARRKAIVDEVFQAVAVTGGLTWDQDPENSNSRINPRLRPVNTLGEIFRRAGSRTAELVGKDETESEQAAKGQLEAYDSEGLFGYNWKDEQKLEAVQDLARHRDGYLDRALIGVGQGLGGDIFNMVATPLELLGSDTAREMGQFVGAIDQSGRLADNKLVEITTGQEYAELASRIVPQVLLTRKVGNVGGGAAAARGATAATQAKVAGYFATGFGGYQSAVFNARDVLDNGGTTGQALGAGILGFGTTFLLANGFNKIGAGGVEQFRSKAATASTVAKRQLSSRLAGIASGALGEGVEEFVDEFINGLYTQDFTGATPEQLAENAFKAGVIGFGIGGTIGGLQAASPSGVKLNDSQVSQSADAAMADLQRSVRGTQREQIARRVQELREKSEAAETIEQPDGTVIETGLTEEETSELENLEAQLRGEASPLNLEETQDTPPATTENTQPPTTTEPVAEPAADTETTEDALPEGVRQLSETKYEVDTLSGKSTIEVSDPVAARNQAIKLAKQVEATRAQQAAEQNTSPTEAVPNEQTAETTQDTTEESNLSIDDLSYRELQNRAARINEAVRTNLQSANNPALTDTKAIRLNSSAAKLREFIKSNESKLESRIDQDQEQPEATSPEAAATEQSSLPLEVGKDGTVTGVDEEGTPLSEEQVEQRLAEEDPIAVDETEDFETVRDAVLDNLNEMDSLLTHEQAEAFDNRISEAATLEELGQIEGEMLAAALEENTDTEKEQKRDEDDPMESPVNRFLRTATKFQKQEFIRRFGEEGEDALDVIADLSTADNAELLTDEELFSDEPLIDDVSEQDLKDAEDDGAPVILYSFIGIPDPALVIKGAKALYKGAKSLVEWSRQMIAAFGDRVRPLLRKMWHDLRRNAGDLKESRIKIGKSQVQQQADTRAEQEFNEDEAATQAEIDQMLEENSPTPSENSNSRIRVPRLLPAWLIENFARDKTGSQNSFIPGLGKAIQYLSLGITTQIHNDLVGEFFSSPVKAWLFGRESAKRRGLYLERQFHEIYHAELATDSDGNMTSPKAREEGTSLRFSDVMESVMEHGDRDYEITNEFKNMVADWKYVLNRILKDAIDEGIPMGFLVGKDGKVDLELLKKNFYAPRGRVSLVDSPQGSSTFTGTGRPRANVRSLTTKREFSSEQEAVKTRKYRYDDPPAKRIGDLVADIYSRIEDHRLANNPEMVANSAASRFETDEKGRRRRVRSLGTNSVTIAGKTYTFENESVRKLNSIIEGQTLNPDEAISRIASVFQGVRSLKFTFDFSAAAIQLAYLWGHSPLRAAKTVAISLGSTLGMKGWMRNYNLKNRDLIAERISVGSLFSMSLADVDFLNETDSSSSGIRKLLSKSLSPFTHFHTVAAEVGANELYAALRYQAMDKETGRIDPIKAEKIARFTDRSSGRESLTRNGVRASTRSILSTMSAAPGMYGAFINMMADITSKDKFTRNQAIKAHGRFIVGMSMLYLAKTMAAMMLDEEDERSTEAKFEDALSRLNPKSRKFMVTEVPIGKGRRVVFSEGGFFKTATQLSARILTDPGNSGEYISRFLKSKKSPGVGTALEILTGEDYFGNEITTLEALADAYVPISLNELAKRHRGPAIDVVAGWLSAITPFDWKGQSSTSLLEEKPHLNQTLEQMIFNSVGLSAYTESSRGEFNRQMDMLSGTLFDGASYRELDGGQKAQVTEEAAKRNIIKPVYKTIDSYAQFQIDRLTERLNDAKARRAMFERNIYAKVAAIPQYSSGVDGTKIHIDSQDHREMYQNFTEGLKELSRREDIESLDSSSFLREARVLWKRQLREFGY